MRQAMRAGLDALGRGRELDRMQRAHEALVAAIGRRDPDAAYRTMEKHLSEALANLGADPATRESAG
jgi:DNA-binding GntR family transcriptional regulator